MLLNRKRTQDEPPANSYTGRKPSFSQDGIRSSLNNSSPPPSTETCIRGRAIVISSSKHILSAFEFFHQRNPSILIDWSLSQQAFNSCMLLLFDAIEHQSITDGALKAERSLRIFRQLEANNAHRLARYAVEKITRALHTLHTIVAQSPHGTNKLHEQQRYPADLQGARQNGATQNLAGVENVMGHTGMQLLGDCDVQASFQEAFAPISWDTQGLSIDLSQGHWI